MDAPPNEKPANGELAGFAGSTVSAADLAARGNRLDGFGAARAVVAEKPPNAGGLEVIADSFVKFPSPTAAGAVAFDPDAAVEPKENPVKGDAGLGGAAATTGAEKENPPNADAGLGCAAAGAIVEEVEAPPKLKDGVTEGAAEAEEVGGAPKLAKGLEGVED